MLFNRIYMHYWYFFIRGHFFDDFDLDIYVIEVRVLNNFFL